LGKAIFETDGLAFDIPKLFQLLKHPPQARMEIACKHTNAHRCCGALQRLRTRYEGPRGRCTAEQRDELASFQLIELHSVPWPGPDCRTSNWRGSVRRCRNDFTTC